jgi:hypothetical protein
MSKNTSDVHVDFNNTYIYIQAITNSPMSKNPLSNVHININNIMLYVSKVTTHKWSFQNWRELDCNQ